MVTGVLRIAVWFRACVGGDRGAKNCCVAVSIFLGDMSSVIFCV